jgi:hypothetical protein
MERVGLHLLLPYVIRDISYSEIIVGQKHVLPQDGVDGDLFLHFPCTFNEEGGWYMGKLALFDRGLDILGSSS